MGCAHPIVVNYELVIAKHLLDMALLQDDLASGKDFVQRAINAIEGYEGSNFQTTKHVRHPVHGLGAGILPDLNDVAGTKRPLASTAKKTVTAVEEAREECVHALKAKDIARFREHVGRAVAALEGALTMYAPQAATAVSAGTRSGAKHVKTPKDKHSLKR